MNNMEQNGREQGAGSGGAAAHGDLSGGGSGALFGADGGSFSEGWVDRLPADFLPAGEREAFRTHAAKYKSPLDVIKSDFNKEKLLGRRGVTVPGERATPEEVAAYRRAIGVPERAEEYNLRPQNLPEGSTWNDDLARPYAAIAHQHHIPQAAMEALVAENVRQQGLHVNATVEALEQRRAEGLATLQRAWRGDFDKNLDLARRGAALAGVDPQSEGFSDPNVVIAFAALAARTAEDRMVRGGGNGPGALQGGALADDIQTNPGNPLYQRYQEGDEETVRYVRSLRVNR